MENRLAFNLEDAIERWQRPLRASGAFTRDNLEELTGHLEDIYQANENFVETGERRFQAAVLQMGDSDTLIKAYARSNEHRLAREYLLFFMAGMVGFVLIYMCMVMLYSLYILGLSRLGLQGVWMDAALVSGMMGQFALLSLILKTSFDSINGVRKPVGKVGFWSLYKLAVLVSCLAGLPLLGGPFRLLSSVEIGDGASALFQQTNLEDLLFFTVSAFVVWWIVSFLLWLGAMFRNSVQMRPATRIQNYRFLSFALGGLGTVLFEIMFRLTDLLMKALVVQWDVGLGFATFLLNMLQLVVLLSLVAIVVICFLRPQVLIRYTKGRRPEVYRWLSWSAVILLVSFLVNEFVIHWLNAQADLTMVQRAIPTVMDYLFPFLLGIVLPFIMIWSYWLQRKGQVILIGN